MAEPVVSGTTSTGFDVSKLLADPNFQSLLAGIGARLDPQGVGGALGGATQQFIQSRASQKALGEQEASRKAVTGLLAGALLPEGDPRKKEYLDAGINYLGGLGPVGQPGPNSVKMEKDGTASINMTLPATQPETGGSAQQTTTPQAATTTATTPQAGAAPATPRKQLDLSTIVPFY